MSYQFNAAYVINAPFCERFDREHCDQFSQIGVDQIARPLEIITRFAMVHNILVKHQPPIFSSQYFLDCDIYRKVTSTYLFVHFSKDYRNFFLV
jgi:hypothetical protein